MTEIITEIEMLTRRVGILTQAIESGGEVDLFGLDDHVHNICEAVLALPEHEARGLRGNVETLLRAIDVLRLALIESAGQVDATGSAQAPPGP